MQSVVSVSDISTPPNTFPTPPTCGTTPPALIRIAQSHGALCQYYRASHSITCTIYLSAKERGKWITDPVSVPAKSCKLKPENMPLALRIRCL